MKSYNWEKVMPSWPCLVLMFYVLKCETCELLKITCCNMCENILFSGNWEFYFILVLLFPFITFSVGLTSAGQWHIKNIESAHKRQLFMPVDGTRYKISDFAISHVYLKSIVFLLATVRLHRGPRITRTHLFLVRNNFCSQNGRCRHDM